MRIAKFLTALCMGTSVCSGCHDKPRATESSNVPASSAAAPKNAAKPAPSAAEKAEKKLGIVWTDPSGFNKVGEASSVRKATYRVPHVSPDTEDAELAVFYFGPGQGGDVQANIQRWISQFPGTDEHSVQRADHTQNGLVEHTVEIPSGTYRGQMTGTPSADKPGFALLGAIVEAPDGRYFFKLTGPQKTVQSARSSFFSMLESVRPR